LNTGRRCAEQKKGMKREKKKRKGASDCHIIKPLNKSTWSGREKGQEKKGGKGKKEGQDHPFQDHLVSFSPKGNHERGEWGKGGRRKKKKTTTPIYHLENTLWPRIRGLRGKGEKKE